jgi:hypothetical protein
LFDIVNHLKLLIWKQDTKYCFAILVELDVACAIYKLVQGINLLICNKFFVVGRFIVFILEVIITSNIVFSKIITWPIGPKMDVVMKDLKVFASFQTLRELLMVLIFPLPNQ